MSVFEQLETTRSKSGHFFSPQIGLGETESHSGGGLDSVRAKEVPKAESKEEPDIADNNYSVEQRLVDRLVSKLAELLHFGKDIAELKALLDRLVLEVRYLSLIFLGSSAEDRLQSLAGTLEMSREELEREETLRFGERLQKVAALKQRNLYLEAEVARLGNLQSPSDLSDSKKRNSPISSDQAPKSIKIASVKLSNSSSPKPGRNIIQLAPSRLESFLRSRSLYVLQDNPAVNQTAGPTVLFVLENSSRGGRRIEVFKKAACGARERSLVERIVKKMNSAPCQTDSDLEQQSINFEFDGESKFTPEPQASLRSLFGTNHDSLLAEDLRRGKKENSPREFQLAVPPAIEKLIHNRYDYDDPPKNYPDLVEAICHPIGNSQSHSNSVCSDELLAIRHSERFLGSPQPNERNDYGIQRDKASTPAWKNGSLSHTGSSKKIQEFVHAPPQSRRLQPHLKFHLDLGWLNSPVYCLKYNRDSSFKSNRNNIYLCGGTTLQDSNHHRFFFLKSSMDALLESKPNLTLKNATLPVLDVYSCYEFTVVAQGNLDHGGRIFLAYPRSSNWHELKNEFLTYYQASLAAEGKRRLRYNNVIHFSSNTFVFVSTLGSLVWTRMHPKNMNQPKEDLIGLKLAPKEYVELISFHYPNVVLTTSSGRVMSTNLLSGGQLVFPQTFESIMGLASEHNHLYLSSATPSSKHAQKGRLHFLEYTSDCFSHLRSVETQTHLIQLTIISEGKASTRKLVAGLPRRGSDSSDHIRMYDFSKDPPVCVANIRDWWSGGLVHGLCQVENILLIFGERTGAEDHLKSSSIAILELKF